MYQKRKMTQFSLFARITCMLTFITLLFSLLFMSSCAAEKLPDLIDSFLTADRIIPSLVSYDALDMYRVKLKFSEAVKVSKALDGGEECVVESVVGSEVILVMNEKLEISSESELYVMVEDYAGNTTAFLLPIYGKNTNLPTFVINEFSARGSTTQPERIELEIRQAGNLEGLYLADGTKDYENYGFTLPDIDVNRGDYVVIYWTLLPEVDSYENISGTTTYNIAAKSSSALGDNNGVFVIYDSKTGNGTILDAIVYSDGNSTTYSGFGSARIESAVTELKNAFEWFSDAIYCNYATTTRTICRRLGSSDTNTASDFYICDTRGQTFGSLNTATEYEVPE